MQRTRDYLTVKGWRRDFKETARDLKYNGRGESIAIATMVCLVYFPFAKPIAKAANAELYLGRAVNALVEDIDKSNRASRGFPGLH